MVLKCFGPGGYTSTEHEKTYADLSFMPNGVFFYGLRALEGVETKRPTLVPLAAESEMRGG